MRKDQVALLFILALTVILVLYFGFESRVTLYLVLISLIFTVSIVFMSSEYGKLDRLLSKDKVIKRISVKDKKLILYYILNILLQRKTLRMQDLALDVGLELAEVHPLVKFLEDRGIIKFMYPPMESVPLIIEEDSAKAILLARQIKKSIAGREFSDQDFQKKVGEEVGKIKDNLKTKTKNSQ